MKIKFIGVPGERHDGLRMYGDYFPLGEFVNVTDKNTIKKLSNHAHFEVKPEKADLIEDAQVKGEFEAVIDSGLKMAEQEQEHGDTNGPGDSSPAKVGKPRGRRGSKRA